MNWGQFKDLVSHMSVAGAVVQPWSITQEVAGSNAFTVMTNILVTVLIEFNESFRENSNKSVNLFAHNFSVFVDFTAGLRLAIPDADQKPSIDFF